MNGFGVGAAVAVGIEIGATIVSPQIELIPLLMLMTVYGLFIGYIFAIWRIALSGVRLPSFAGGRLRSSALVFRFLRTLFSTFRPASEFFGATCIPMLPDFRDITVCLRYVVLPK